MLKHKQECSQLELSICYRSAWWQATRFFGTNRYLFLTIPVGPTSSLESDEPLDSFAVGDCGGCMSALQVGFDTMLILTILYQYKICIIEWYDRDACMPSTMGLAAVMCDNIRFRVELYWLRNNYSPWGDWIRLERPSPKKLETAPVSAFHSELRQHMPGGQQPSNIKVRSPPAEK